MSNWAIFVLQGSLGGSRKPGLDFDHQVEKHALLSFFGIMNQNSTKGKHSYRFVRNAKMPLANQSKEISHLWCPWCFTLFSVTLFLSFFPPVPHKSPKR